MSSIKTEYKKHGNWIQGNVRIDAEHGSMRIDAEHGNWIKGSMGKDAEQGNWLQDVEYKEAWE